jgi:hypothetical protein
LKGGCGLVIVVGKGEPEDLEDLTDDEVTQGIERHYDGRWIQFLEDNRPV